MKYVQVALLVGLAGCDDGCCGTVDAKQDSTLRMPVAQTTAFANLQIGTSSKTFTLAMNRYAADCGSGAECEFYYYIDAADDLRIQGTTILNAAYRAAPTTEISLDVTQYSLPFDVELVRGKYVLGRFHFQTGTLTYDVPTTVSVPGTLNLSWTTTAIGPRDQLAARLTTCASDTRARSDSYAYRELSIAALHSTLPIAVPAACQQTAIELQLIYDARGTVAGFTTESSAELSVVNPATVPPTRDQPRLARLPSRSNMRRNQRIRYDAWWSVGAHLDPPIASAEYRPVERSVR